MLRNAPKRRQRRRKKNRKLEVNHSEIDSKRFALSLETVGFNVSEWNSRVSSPRGLSLYRLVAVFLWNYQSVGENLCCTTVINNWITFNLSDNVFFFARSKLPGFTFLSVIERLESKVCFFVYPRKPSAMVWFDKYASRCAIPLPWFWSSLLKSLSC